MKTWVRCLGGEDTLEEEMATSPVFSLGKPHGQRSLVGYSPKGHKECDVTERLGTGPQRKVKVKESKSKGKLRHICLKQNVNIHGSPLLMLLTKIPLF